MLCYPLSYIVTIELIIQIEYDIIGLDNSYNKIRFILKNRKDHLQEINSSTRIAFELLNLETQLTMSN